MRSHGSARRSLAIWSRRCVSSFSRASSFFRSASHCSLETAERFFMMCALFLSIRSAHGADLSARAAAAVEAVGAVGLEPADAGAARHLQPLEHRAALRVDPAQIALVALPGAVPQLAVDPGHAGDEAVGLDGAQDRVGLGIDLVDLAIAVLPDPQAALGPGES